MTSAYTPPTFTAPIELDLSRNEGRPRVTTMAQEEPSVATLTSRYPDTTALREAIAARNGVSPDRVLVTAGADDALARCISSVMGAPIVGTTPSFEMIARYACQVRSPLIEVPWWSGPFPVAELVSRDETRLAVVVSPNNPTGSAMSAEELAEVSAGSRMVVLDAAYEEFASEPLTKVALRLGNVVVTRTLSKAFGLAGLRVGYAIGSAEMISEIAGFGSPFSVSSLSAALAQRVLAGPDGSLEEYVASVRDRRTRLTHLLDEVGCAPLVSQGNFVLATDVDSARLVEAAAERGVGLRRFPGRERLERCVRITVPGDEDDYARLEETLRAVLAGPSEESSDVA